MPAEETLGHYQFGRYMFTREYSEEMAKPYTRYQMTRQPNEAEREGLGDRNAPAFEASTMDVTHHPAAEPLFQNQVFGTASGRAAHREWQQQRAANTVGNQAFKERHLPTDEVDYLTVEKGSRIMVPTMLGLGQRAARERTGKDLQASSSLSEHSQRLVDKLKAGGMVPEDHFSIPNEMNFLPAWPVNTPGGLEGHLSTLHARIKHDDAQERPIPATEVAAAKEEGRQMIRRMRPKPSA